MSKQNPEDHVLDAIAELVNEQLAVGPVDDYTQNRYPGCDGCEHEWHGEQCHWCPCKQSTGERKPPSYRQRVVEAGYQALAQIEAMRDLSGIQDHRGYTLADIEAMRRRPRRDINFSIDASPTSGRGYWPQRIRITSHVADNLVHALHGDIMRFDISEHHRDNAYELTMHLDNVTHMEVAGHRHGFIPGHVYTIDQEGGVHIVGPLLGEVAIESQYTYSENLRDYSPAYHAAHHTVTVRIAAEGFHMRALFAR